MPLLTVGDKNNMITLHDQFVKVKNASRELAHLTDAQVQAVLYDFAHAIVADKASLLKEHQKDLDRMDPQNPVYDRLFLNAERLDGIARELRNVAELASPIGDVLEERDLPNGLHLKRVRVPLGVVGVIYEARPNVTVDVFALCFKARNACVLKGGSDAYDTNTALVTLIHKVLLKQGIDPSMVFFMSNDRESVKELLTARDTVDVIIPRGSQGLIDFVIENATVPVIETGSGIVHTYFDVSGDAAIGSPIIFNAKTRRPAVCNALDTLIIHQDRLKDLPALVAPLAAKEVVLFCDPASFAVLDGKYVFLQPALPEHFGTEFLSLQMSVKTVSSVEEAVAHITQYSSKHSEAIIAEDVHTIEYFLQNVDAAVVYANTSTGFTDGAQFGLGAEIGISTQKLHARGPMALRELTTYKWIVRGSGQVRG